ncbi:lysylphosphatidylglycerol synthase domain-containing protein [Sphingomonas sp. 10B4]|uniref:lysylphosphatidylglycerol synthase domain-containing protein n=1 Tax=Sphingomonas sp. 10B4 TaxID=3048575 RepID=UPI002AB59187|nr:lysylphosphatidylglycerol synthase domain-containing protein [Sphingomonas sp. 10B4]MDY7523193.1 lysylphosphatidylglycerol synthase domain-containing protein [Sphingomonas sp. 10B4]MEB0282663.1 lysylphosphatidylglycerol synthase domain-containing protein [Sphingomonas sp. 10B4]
MSRSARIGLLLATIVGLAVAAGTVGTVGIGQVLAAMASIGWIGMATFVLWSAGVLGLLGMAWLAVATDQPSERLWLFVWARTTREAATDILPFSQLGGLVVGARTLAAFGVPQPVIYASMIADMTTEMAAQLIFTLGGVAVLLMVLSHAPVQQGIVSLALGGVAAMIALMLLFVFAQKPVLKLAGSLGARMLPGSVAAMAAVRDQLDAIYREPKRVLLAFAFNLAAWLASATGAWIALQFMGSHVPLWAVLMIEALIFTLRSVAFAIPGAIGVQEAAYVLIGPLVGLPPATALALSLLKRARDVIIAVPALLAWQVGEARRVVS